MAGEVKMLTKAEFDDLVAAETKLIVIDFYATWCGPCKMIAPKIQELAKSLDDVVFAKVDVDEEEDLAQECGVEAMPTFLFYKGGKKVDEMKGANKEKLEELVQKHRKE